MFMKVDTVVKMLTQPEFDGHTTHLSADVC